MSEAKLELRCTEHPTYMAKRKPTADCVACRDLWVMHGTEEPAPVETIESLLLFLTNSYPDYYYEVEETKRYWKILMALRLKGTEHMTSTSVYAFVAKEDFSNKSLGTVRAGAILKPQGWSRPARHERAFLHDRSTWADNLGQYGVAYLR